MSIKVRDIGIRRMGTSGFEELSKQYSGGAASSSLRKKRFSGSAGISPH